MNSRTRVASFLPVLLAALPGACGGSHGPSPGEEETGKATAALGVVPAAVGCVEIDVVGARTVTSRFDVAQGQMPVLSLSGLPLGTDTFNALAYPTACKSVTGTAQATWISDSVSAPVASTTVANVTLTLRPNGRASVGVGFESDDAGSEAGTGAVLSGNGCAGGTCLNPSCAALGTAAPVGTAPGTGFDTQPAFIPNDVVILTLDDGPDGTYSPPDPAYGAGGWTTSALQFLDMNNLHLDFFLNTDNWCGDVTPGPTANPTCDSAIVDILTLHNPGNHTVHHIHMGVNLPPDTTQTPPFPQSCDGASSMDSCDAEIAGVESVVNTLSNGGRPHLTRFRPPYGEPYQISGPGLADVSAVVAKYAVWVGWNIDSGDSLYNGTSCATTPCPTGAQIAGNVETLLGSAPGQGRWGIVLMHSTFPWTRDALPLLLGTGGYLATHGFRVGTVEDAICWKYGMHSWQVVQAASGQSRGPN
jgi:peptidoglycan/xylan/chitin deacetylase (PgdA/CDA1 family)